MVMQSRHSRRMQELANKQALSQKAKDEGKWTIKFVFDGIEHKRTHQLSATEVKHMKELCAQFGDEAAQQIIWRAAIKGVGVVSENIMADAAIAYIKKHYSGPVITGDEPNRWKTRSYGDLIESEEVAAVLEDYIASTKPLPEEKAFDPTEREKIEQQIMGENL